MEDIGFIKTGIELIAENVEKHQEAVKQADETFDDGFARLITAKDLLQQAAKEIFEADKCFKTARSILGTSTTESLMTAQNTAKAIELRQLGQEPAIRLTDSLGYLASLTGALLGFYKKNTVSVHIVGSLLDQSDGALETHLDIIASNTTADDIADLCNVTRDVAGQIKL